MDSPTKTIVEAQVVCRCGNAASPLYGNGDCCENYYVEGLANLSVGTLPIGTPPSEHCRAICPVRVDRHRSGRNRREQ